jgi:DNA-binding LacI/PurR family transcriptional regulator
MRFDPAGACVVSIGDVAKSAGVSTSTVSYVLSGKRPISKETADRVQRAIRDLGYRPNAGARALAGGRTNVLALVVPLRADQNVPVVMEFAAAVVTRARRSDYDVLLLTQDEGVGGVQRVAASALADAFIVMDLQADDPRLPVLRALEQPAVLIGLPDRPVGLSAVDLHFAAAAALAVDHLADLGHHALALVGAPEAVYERRTGYAQRTLAGFEKACVRRDVAAVTTACEPSFDGLRRAVTDVLTRQPGTTGWLVHNESVLPSVVAVLAEQGLRVPDDASVVAVCPDDMADTHAVAFTNIGLPAADVGEIAVEMALRHLDGASAVETRLLSPVLTERDSTRAL